jgi:hypothetical protein
VPEADSNYVKAFLSLFLLVVAVGMAYQLYLSPGYALISKPATMGTYDERPAYASTRRQQTRPAVGSHIPWKAGATEPWLMVPAADLSRAIALSRG